MGNVHVGRGKINCVSLAHIILGAFMAVCGAIQIMLQLRYLWLDSIYAGIWVGLWVSIYSVLYLAAATARSLLLKFIDESSRENKAIHWNIGY